MPRFAFFYCSTETENKSLLIMLVIQIILLIKEGIWSELQVSSYLGDFLLLN